MSAMAERGRVTSKLEWGSFEYRNCRQQQDRNVQIADITKVPPMTLDTTPQDVLPLPGSTFCGLWLDDSGVERSREKPVNPPWTVIATWLERLRTHSGMVRLSLIGRLINVEDASFKDRNGKLVKEVQEKRRELSIRKVRGYFWVTMLDNETSDDFGEVRTYTNPKPNPALKGLKVEVHPDMYADETEVIEDFDLVVSMAREFYQTGDVSHDLLS